MNRSLRKPVRLADPHAGLLRHLEARMAKEGLAAELRESHSERWASATFTGARHRFRFSAASGGEAGGLDRISRELGEADFTLPDHIVADIALVRRRDGADFDVEALTVEAR